MANNLTESILEHVGGISKNNLLTILENSEDIDSSISVISESPYIDTQDITVYRLTNMTFLFYLLIFKV